MPVMRRDADPLLACPPESRTEMLATRTGVPTVALPFRPLRHSGGARETVRSVLRGVESVRDLRRLLRQHRERRIVYCTSMRPGMLAGLAGLGLRVRNVWFIESWVPSAPVGWLVRALALLGCAQAVATSQATGKRFVGRVGVLRRRTQVLYPGTDLERFRPSEARPGSARAAIVGEVSETKRTDLALEIAARVGREHASFELDVVGRAQFRESDFAFERRLQGRVREDPLLRDRIRFCGHTDDVPEALRSAGMLLHCRPDEPFGIALVEAMALGLPVVAPGSAGPAEIVEDGVTGFLYPPGDAEAAARCIARLVLDRKLAQRMGRAGRESAARRFASTDYVASIERLLEELD